MADKWFFGLALDSYRAKTAITVMIAVRKRTIAFGDEVEDVAR
jgi:hypothetical protein